MRIAIVSGSTRPGRNSIAVARWVHERASMRRDAAFELVDIADYQLPMLDEPLPAALGRYTHAHTKRWAAKIGSFDGYVFVTPEYNHGVSAALKNAIDYLYAEWHHKAAGFVGYGANGGTRAVEQLRLVMGNLLVADVTAQVALSLFADFENLTVFRPEPRRASEVDAMLDQVIAWAGALQDLRASATAEAA